MTWNDPNAQQEAQNYDNPIPSRLLILQTLADKGELTHKQLAESFGIDNEDQFDALGNRLKAMSRDGQVNRDGRPYKYRAVTKQDVVTS